jgi:hypothetical protein
MPGGLIVNDGRKYKDKYTILNFPTWRALEAFAKKVPLGNSGLQSNDLFRRFVESNLHKREFGLFGKQPKSFKEAMARKNFVYKDEYKKIKEKAEKAVREKLQLSSVAEVMKPKFVYNDKQIGEFIYDRAAMSLKPKIYWYCPSEDRLVDSIKEKIYTYAPSLNKVIKDEKIIKDGFLMVLDDSNRTLLINAIEKDGVFIEVVQAIKVKTKDGVKYMRLKGEETLKEARKKGVIDCTSSNKKVYLYKEKKPKEYKAIKIIVGLTKGGLTDWENDFYTGVAAALLVEVLESLEYSVEIVVALGGGRCDGSICGPYPLNFDGVFTHGRRYFFFTAKKFDELADMDGLLYTVADPSFHNIKFISLFNSFLTFFGDTLDTQSGDPAEKWHGIQEDDIINPLGAFQKALDHKNGNKGVLHFYIHKIADEQEIIQRVSDIAITCENMNREALLKYRGHDFKDI